MASALIFAYLTLVTSQKEGVYIPATLGLKRLCHAQCMHNFHSMHNATAEDLGLDVSSK